MVRAETLIRRLGLDLAGVIRAALKFPDGQATKIFRRGRVYKRARNTQCALLRSGFTTIGTARQSDRYLTWGLVAPVFTRTGGRIREERNSQCTFCNSGAGRSGAGRPGAASSARRSGIGRAHENKRLGYFRLVHFARIGLNFQYANQAQVRRGWLGSTSGDFGLEPHEAAGKTMATRGASSYSCDWTWVFRRVASDSPKATASSACGTLDAQS